MNERNALQRALDEAYDKGFLGKNACGSGCAPPHLRTVSVSILSFPTHVAGFDRHKK